MSWLAPFWLAAAGASALAAVALHFLSRRRPRAVRFATARFVPDRPTRAASRAPRPTDLALLALRVLALLLAGAALAGPVRERARRPVARVLAVDLSSATALRSAAARGLELARQGDVLVLFDSAARIVRGGAMDTLRALAAATTPRDAMLGSVRGSLSAALVAARRAAPALAAQADSVELLLVSPFAAEEWDAATPEVRARWPGRLTIERVAAAAPAAIGPRPVVLRAAADDPLRATVALLGGAAPARVRIVRDALTGADSAWARDSAAVLVHWPSEEGAAGWLRAARTDTVGAVVAGDVVVVAGFAREHEAPDGRAIAWWVDGTVAATERVLGDGCLRSVAIPVPSAGDLVLRERFRHLTSALLSPCGGARDLRPLGQARLATLAGGGALAPGRALGAPTPARSPATPWLLGAALLVVAIEPLARRRVEGT